MNQLSTHTHGQASFSSRPVTSLHGGSIDGAPLFDGQEQERQFGEHLVGAGTIDRATLERAQGAAHATGERLDRVLTKLGLLSEVDLTAALSAYCELPIGSMADLPVEPMIPDLVHEDFVRCNKVIPLVMGKESLVVGIVDPFDIEPVRALSFATDRKIDRRLFSPADFEKAIGTLYGRATHEVVSTSRDGEGHEHDVQRLRDIASEAPVIRLVNQIVAAAIEAGASDIHVEPGVDRLLVRYRLDGMLRVAQTLSPALRPAVTSRIKLMAKLDIAEHRLPQDGRIRIAVRGVDIDFRVSTIPTAFGESVVMRVLDRSRIELDFTKLGFSGDQVSMLNLLIQEPNGVLLVTGPTGSGKTTTLYTALKGLNCPERKLFSVEDPVEYQIAGINQLQVQPDIGLTFPAALRAILRQDPDVIMIGEIRDQDTARIAIQASLTGHFVLSTVHTNSAAAAFSRLIDIGIEPYLLASTIRGVVAQRLVRKLCPHCSRSHDAVGYWCAEIERIVPRVAEQGAPNIRMSVGCSKCGGTGYSGRETIAEILTVNDEVRRLIQVDCSDVEIEAAARRNGMLTMFQMGAAAVWRGETSIEEVARVTRID